MTNYTPYYYAWDDTSLEDYLHGIDEFAEGRDSIPPWRGENKVVMGAWGRLHTVKVPDERVITLTGWVNGTNENGTIIDEQEWRYNVRALRDLLYDPTGDQHELSKGIPTSPSTIIRVKADAQVTGGLKMNVDDAELGMQIARWTADFTLAYPFYRDLADTTDYL